MLKLLAITPEDGWAFVSTDESLLLVRPPYSRSNTRCVSKCSLENAVARHGFSASDRDFADWRGLVRFLNDEVRRSRKARGEQIEREGLGARMMQFAPDDVLDRFLGRVEAELLPSGAWEPAERMLIDMLKLPQVCQKAAFLSRVSDLLDRTVTARRDAEARRQDVLEDDDILTQCPGLKQRYDSESEALAKFNRRLQLRGKVLPVGR